MPLQMVHALERNFAMWTFVRPQLRRCTRGSSTRWSSNGGAARINLVHHRGRRFESCVTLDQKTISYIREPKKAFSRAILRGRIDV